MSIHKKNIIIFILLDIAYLILSVNVILNYYLSESASWYSYIPLALIVMIGVVGLLINRKNDQALLPISKFQYQLTRAFTLSYLVVYVIQMFIIPKPLDYPAILSILVGSFLGLIGLSALSLHVYILQKGHKK